MAYQHGIKNKEQDTSLTTPQQSTAALQVIFGTAPIHLAADPYAAANEPKLCYSFAECQSALGYSEDFSKFTLCQSMDANFRVFNNAPLILINVLDPTKHVTANEARSVAGEAFYQVPYVLLDTLVVKSGETELVADVDYAAEHADDGTVIITLLSDTALALQELQLSSKSIDPAAVNKGELVGGVDTTTGKETGLELVRQIYPKLGLVPGLLLAPGWSQDPVVAAALQAKTEAINGMFDCNTLLDIPADEDGAVVYTAVKTAKEKLGASSKHAIALWPMLSIGDKQYYFSAIMGALIANTDAGNADVPYESPSNKKLKVTAAVLKDGKEVVLDQEQANLLNSYGVVTALNADGFRAWGNNTAAYPGTTDPKDRWISVRRFFDWDGNNFVLTYREKVDNPANRRLIENIVDSQNVIGNGYVARGYCAGYRVVFRSDENQPTDLLDGQLRLHTYLAPYIPAEYIENTREYDVDALTAALGGE